MKFLRAAQKVRNNDIRPTLEVEERGSAVRRYKTEWKDRVYEQNLKSNGAVYSE